MATHSISRKITSILYLMKIMPAFWMKTEFCEVMFSLRSADAFPVVASLFFGGREATTGNASALRRLSHVRFKKKKLKREVFSVMSEEISPLMCRRCGTHIIYYILSCYKFICQLHQVYMHAYLNLRSNMTVMACSLRSNITLRKLSFQGLFY